MLYMFKTKGNDHFNVYGADFFLKIFLPNFIGKNKFDMNDATNKYRPSPY